MTTDFAAAVVAAALMRRHPRLMLRASTVALAPLPSHRCVAGADMSWLPASLRHGWLVAASTWHGGGIFNAHRWAILSSNTRGAEASILCGCYSATRRRRSGDINLTADSIFGRAITTTSDIDDRELGDDNVRLEWALTGK